jgi:HAD superfamily hydrolase (TIGR01509 family)
VADANTFTTVILDVDGTLIDSNGAHADAYLEALRLHSIKGDPAHIRRLIGMGGDKVIPALVGVAEDSPLGQSIAREKNAVFARLLPGLRPTRGARELVLFVRDEGIDLVVATSASKEDVAPLLEQAGIADLLPRRVTKDDADSSKPEPDVIRAALDKAGALPEAAVMLGDTPYDIEAAARLAVTTIAVRCGGFWTDGALHGAAGIFDDPADLLEHWRATRLHRPAQASQGAGES